MHKPQKYVVVLPWWTLIALVATLVSLFPAFLFCVREIVFLKSRVDEQQLKIASLESVTAQIRSRTVGDKISSDETSEEQQRFFKLEVRLFFCLYTQICHFFSSLTRFALRS